MDSYWHTWWTSKRDIIIINDTLFAANENNVFKSINNGEKWVRNSEGLPSGFKVKKFSYVNKLFFLVTDMGVFSYSFNQKSWNENAYFNPPIANFYHYKVGQDYNFDVSTGEDILTYDSKKKFLRKTNTPHTNEKNKG